MPKPQYFLVSTKPTHAASTYPSPGWDYRVLLPWAILSPRTKWMERKGTAPELDNCHTGVQAEHSGLGVAPGSQRPR